MALSLNSLLGIGTGALSASQSAIQTTGNNLANVNTPGYTRRSVRFEERWSLNSRPGQMGMGVDAVEVYRQFDRFIESAYLGKSTLSERFAHEYSMMRTVDGIFHQTDTSGLSSALGAMFNAWSKLAQDPTSQSSRVALLEKARIFTSSVRGMDASLRQLKEQIDKDIAEQVSVANVLIQDIASLNREINAQEVKGHNNPNQLLDLRDQKTRDLAAILDIKVEDKGGGNYNITTGSGQILVQEDLYFSLSFNAPRVENNLRPNSTYNGTVGFEGTDGYEYTVEIVKPGQVDNTGKPDPKTTAQYRVSLDGGKTWLKGDDGQDKLFFATTEDYSSKVKNLQIFFDGTTDLVAGDKFLLTPKSDVFWNSPTSSPIDISTQTYPDGTENGQRITGGKLAALLNFRDNKATLYLDQLAKLTETITWELNKIHSQGSGLNPLKNVVGSYSVQRTNVPMGSNTSGFHWADRLQKGNITFAIYGANGKPELPYPGIEVFSPENFDPSKHSLQDVVSAINSGPASTYLRAEIIDNKLQLTAQEGYSFGVTADTTGLAAGLGINTFFSGSSSDELEINSYISQDPNLINAARINGAGEGNKGDNQVAKEIAELNKKIIAFTSWDGKTTRQTIPDFFGTMVTKVGSDTQAVKFIALTEHTMERELFARREEISGVNMDEELSNLIKFQSSYKAAAKLITTTEQMLDTLLSLKQ